MDHFDENTWTWGFLQLKLVDGMTGETEWQSVSEKTKNRNLS